MSASLAAEGLRLSTGTIVDAAFVEAPSSTKNARRARDPEARSSKRGKNWHFGYKAHVGLDAEGGTVHALVVTPANASDLSQAAALVRPGDTDVWADAGYVGVAGRLGGCASPSAEWHVARRKGSVPEGERPAESLLASTRPRVEHAFHALKDLLGFRKTRCRGLAKVENRLYASLALANALCFWSRKNFGFGHGNFSGLGTAAAAPPPSYSSPLPSMSEASILRLAPPNSRSLPQVTTRSTVAAASFSSPSAAPTWRTLCSR